MNSDGKVGFVASLAGPEVNSTNNVGIWQEQNRSLTLLARTGSSAPGTKEGVVFSRLHPHYVDLVGRGTMAFRERLSGSGVDDTNEYGVWSQAGGSLHLA
jgi:hypothetical protein